MIAQSFRYWLADLITGGELTRAKADNAMWFEASAQLGAKLVLAVEAHEDELRARDLMLEVSATLARQYGAALRTIAAMETPGANATVRRMARVALEAVK